MAAAVASDGIKEAAVDVPIGDTIAVFFKGGIPPTERATGV